MKAFMGIILCICAEGIETESALQYLHKLGCNQGQGYFFSPPIPGDQIPEWVDKWQKKFPESMSTVI